MVADDDRCAIRSSWQLYGRGDIVGGGNDYGNVIKYVLDARNSKVERVLSSAGIVDSG
jgi:hypothetical protein